MSRLIDFCDKMHFSTGKIGTLKTISGVPPLTIPDAVRGVIQSIKIIGNTTEDGGVGDYNSVSEKYEIPISCNGMTITSELANRLDKLESVSDDYNITTGIGTKKNSSVMLLTGNDTWYASVNYTGYKQCLIALSGFSEAPLLSDIIPAIVYNHDGTALTTKAYNVALSAADQVKYSSDKTRIVISVSNNDTGFPDGYTPTAAEWKAYFYGYKMCNADSSSPYAGTGTKYWKRITDGLGITSTLPTASYDGYNPYSMIYKLANSVPITGTRKYLPIPSGESTISVGTTVQPSNLEVTYYGL